MWLELTSEHFTVWTDSPPAQARALARTMEHLRNVVLGVSFFKRDSSVRSFVIAFRNLEEVHAFVPPQFIAHAWSARNPLAQVVINACFAKAKAKLDFTTMSLEVDLAGDPAVGSCMEAVLRSLSFPSGYPGTFHIGTRNPE